MLLKQSLSPKVSQGWTKDSAQSFWSASSTLSINLPLHFFSQVGRGVDLIPHFLQESHTLFPQNPAEHQPQVPPALVCVRNTVEVTLWEEHSSWGSANTARIRQETRSSSPGLLSDVGHFSCSWTIFCGLQLRKAVLLGEKIIYDTWLLVKLLICKP